MKSSFSPSTSGLPDSELANLAGQGDSGAFETIMRRYNQLMFRTARSVLKNDDDAQDAVQEAYLNAWRAIKSFRSDAKLSTWLVRIVLNEALGRIRKRSGSVVPLDMASASSPFDPEDSMEANRDEQPDHLAARAEMRRLIESRIDALPDVFRTVFMLRAVEEQTVEDVAIMLGIPEPTVRSRFFRARSLLRESLSRDIDIATGDAFSFAGSRCDGIVAHVLGCIESDDSCSPNV